ncbi:MAG: hypothetical protein HKN04_10750 [Rhodothermaceae bacterium]|nr:hypothetical protein [Rhodothermaceae bacterium]
MSRLCWILPLLLLAACGDADTTDPDFAAEGESPAAAAPMALAGGADCLLGTWAVDAEYSFRPEVWDNLTQGSDDLNFEFAGASGQALLTFERGGAARSDFNDFEITIDADTPAGAMNTTVALDGTAASSYRVEDDQLLFEPGPAELTSSARATLGGREMMNSTMDFESLFETAERGTMTFDCQGDELLLDISAPASAGGQVLFENARYVRAG